MDDIRTTVGGAPAAAGSSPRSTAAFWMRRFATAARDGHPGDIAERDSADVEDDEADVGKQAIFALSRLPRREGIPALLDVARHHRDPRVRPKARFWLGQSGDPRAWALFEALLAGTRQGDAGRRRRLTRGARRSS